MFVDAYDFNLADLALLDENFSSDKLELFSFSITVNRSFLKLDVHDFLSSQCSLADLSLMPSSFSFHSH